MTKRARDYLDNLTHGDIQKLAAFGLLTLSTLEHHDKWSADTLEEIDSHAEEHSVRSLNARGLFVSEYPIPGDF